MKVKTNNIFTTYQIAIGITIFAVLGLLTLSFAFAGPSDPNDPNYPIADTNSDLTVDIFDLSYMLSNWGTDDSKADFNSDSVVSILDLSYLLAQWGRVDTVDPGNMANLKGFGMSVGGGFQYQSAEVIQAQLDDMVSLGVDWIRVDFSWSDIQSGGQSSYNWSRYDVVADEAKIRDIQVLGILAYTPRWARPSTCTFSDKCAPENPADFGQFAAATASRYSSKGIDYWEIWNEPNISNFWLPSPDVNSYVDLLITAHQKIKNSSNSAVVITGGTSPASTSSSSISPIDFVEGIYAAGGKDYFDAISHHPYCYAGTFDCPSTYAEWSAWSQMNLTTPSIRSVMIDNDDAQKQIWLTEFGAPTNGVESVSEAQQATMLEDAYTLQQSESWAGPLFWYTYKDSGTDINDREDWFGIIRSNGELKPSYTTLENVK